MLNFRQWLFEIAELRKPTTKVRKRNIIKDKGTNVAKSAILYQWKTKLGNVVKIHFIPKGEDIYEIVFYVNDTLDDQSHKTDESQRDAEIIPGVFYIIRDKAEKLNAKELTFVAHSSDGDEKTIRNIEIEPKKQITMQLLKDFYQTITNHIPKLVPLSNSRLATIKKFINPNHNGYELDFEKEPWIRWTSEITNIIKNQNNPPIHPDALPYELKNLAGNLLSAEYKFEIIKYNPKDLYSAIVDLSNALQSHTERGWTRKSNRRTAIYSRMVNRYLSDRWNVETSNDRFVLIRKSNNL
jgi:hypothetical protein